MPQHWPPPPPPPPPGQSTGESQGQSADHANDIEPQALRADHFDHDTAYARAMYAELRPKKEEQVTLPRWTVIVIFLMVVVFVLLFTRSTFINLSK